MRYFIAAIGVLACFALVGCGATGPLYLPKSSTQPEQVGHATQVQQNARTGQ